MRSMQILPYFFFIIIQNKKIVNNKRDKIKEFSPYRYEYYNIYCIF